MATHLKTKTRLTKNQSLIYNLSQLELTTVVVRSFYPQKVVLIFDLADI